MTRPINGDLQKQSCFIWYINGNRQVRVLDYLMWEFFLKVLAYTTMSRNSVWGYVMYNWLCLFIAFLSLSLLGCAARPANKVTYISPDSYRGIAKIRMNQPGGIVVEDDYTIRFPKSGIIEIQGKDPLMNWHRLASRYESGEIIVFDNDPSIDYPPDLIILYHLGYSKDQAEHGEL